MAVLGAIGIVRLLELRYSRANQRSMAARGITMAPDPAFRLMVVLHLGVMGGSVLEARLARRPWIPALGVPMAVALAAANLLRWWVIRSLAGHWNMRVMRSAPMGVVTTGPYRWVRHPNYVALLVELEAMPLLHSAWVTALAGGAAHVLILRKRIATEEAVLAADPAYQAMMGGKPRFVPGLFVSALFSPGLLTGAR